MTCQHGLFPLKRSEITRLCWWFILIPCRLLRQVAKFTPPLTCGEASYFIVMGVKLHALANTTKRPISWKGLGNSLIHFNTPLTCDGEDKSTHVNLEVRLKRPIGGAKSNFRINCKSQHSNSRPKLWYHVKLHALANAIKDLSDGRARQSTYTLQQWTHIYMHPHTLRINLSNSNLICRFYFSQIQRCWIVERTVL